MWFAVSVSLGLAGLVLFGLDVRERGRRPGRRWSFVEVYNNSFGLRGWLGLVCVIAGALTLLAAGNG